jgi:adenylate cyclase
MSRFQIGPWSVDPRARTLRRDGAVRRVSPKAMAVLETLAAANGAVVSRLDLMDAAWPDTIVGDDVLTHAVSELRKALGPGLVATVYKSGYRLCESVRWGGSANRHGRSAGNVLAAYLSAQTLADDGGKSNTLEAIRLYREAVAADPEFVLAHAGLATSLIKLLHYYGGDAGLLHQAMRNAEVAVAVDPSSAEAHAALGAALSSAGRYDESLACFTKAVCMRPDAAEPYRLLGRVYFVHGAHAAAVTACERAARLRADEFQCLIMGAKALRALGQETKARDWMRWARLRIDQRLAEEPDNLRALCNLVCCQIEAGEFDAAFPEIKRLRAESDGMVYYLVGALARAGHIDLALDQLETVTDCGWSHGAYLAHDPDLNALRRERRFRRIAERIGA